MSREHQAQSIFAVDGDVIAYPGAAVDERSEPSEPTPEPSKGSSGLIRAGLIAAMLFVGVSAAGWSLSSWMMGLGEDDISDAQLTVATDPQQTVGSEYQRLRKAWVDGRALVDMQQTRKRDALAQAQTLEATIDRQKKSLAEAETALAAAQAAEQEARTKVEIMTETVADLNAASPDRALETAQAAVDQAEAEATAAQKDLRRAKAEEARIKATVAELRKAVKAAEAASKAARIVVAAADSAKAAVASNHDVMAEADAPTLSNLENDFFAEARVRAEAAEKSASAAREAVSVAEVRLDILAQQKVEYEKRFAEANELEAEAHKAMNSAREAHGKHRRAVAQAEAELAKANDTLAGLVSRVTQAETRRDDRAAKLAELRSERDALSRQTQRSDKTLALALKDFRSTELALKKIQREHSARAAVVIAELNAELNERVREALGEQPMDVPVFDRVVMSSEQLFDTGSALLSSSGRKLLSEVVPVVQSIVAKMPEGTDWVLRVDGHTDAQPLSGTGRYRDNWELSQARALAVVKFLIDESQLNAQQLSANGFGEYQPINSGTSAAALAQNRRIELTLAAR